jgi:phage terminase small subunit
MPALFIERHEQFSQAIAEGLSGEKAYLKAGYASTSGHGARLLDRPDVAARVDELRAEREALRKRELEAASAERAKHAALQAELVGATRAAVIGALLRLAERDDLTGPAGVREARQSLLEAFALAQGLGLDA